MLISFYPLMYEHLPLWKKWVQKKHVKDVWFIEGYETVDYIYKKIEGNGYDYPFIIALNDEPIGYIVCCDLYRYRMQCPNPKGLFTHESPGVFCMDLFIGEEEFLGKGYGAPIVRTFVNYIFSHFNAQIIFIDPAITNKQAIRCYEKAGFIFAKEAFDGVTNCHVMKIEKG
ncbi:MAG: GNAT family N-acetyltransferase [Gammaproteobacteria bacterium]